MMVEALAKELQRCIKLGYTRKDLAELLSRHGVQIHPNMLGQYIRDSKKDRSHHIDMKRRVATRNNDVAKKGAVMLDGTGASVIESPTLTKSGTQGVERAAHKQVKDHQAQEPVKSGKTDASNRSNAKIRDHAASSGGFTVRSDSNDI